ncbi:MAG: hypothetical protein QNJ31_01355 [Candidatus Caenarcaniphilales bacterium]|nr:hypothetical protein [Candidatus Caenarcaniphilales bacterium]
MNEIFDSIKLMNAKLDSIISLLDVLVRKSDLVNDEDDETTEVNQKIQIKQLNSLSAKQREQR